MYVLNQPTFGQLLGLQGIDQNGVFHGGGATPCRNGSERLVQISGTGIVQSHCDDVYNIVVEPQLAA